MWPPIIFCFDAGPHIGSWALPKACRQPVQSEEFMSEAPQTPEHDGPHEGPIKTPKQLMLAVFFSFVIPIVVIALLVEFVTSKPRPAAGSDGLNAAAVAQRIEPVGQVQVKDLSDLSTLKTGEQVFTAQCSSCHAAGLVGAPKFGDAAAWAPRIAQGYDALLQSALNGKGNMGAQGGGDYADIEVGRAVVYMANKAGANFDEPKAPAAGAAAADETTGAMTSAPAAAGNAGDVAAAIAAAKAGTEDSKSNTASAAPALYTQVCQACHAAGVAGAPKFGDKAAWATAPGSGWQHRCVGGECHQRQRRHAAGGWIASLGCGDQAGCDLHGRQRQIATRV